MADLSTNFLGIKSPNPFWLASAPPRTSGVPRWPMAVNSMSASMRNTEPAGASTPSCSWVSSNSTPLSTPAWPSIATGRAQVRITTPLVCASSRSNRLAFICSALRP